MAESKGLAGTALALGIFGLFSAGGLGVGSLIGLALAGAALTGVPRRGGRDVAWAAVAANAFALLTLLPVGAAFWVYSRSPLAFVEDDSLPVPAQQLAFADGLVAQPIPPPPPPPPTTRHTAKAAESGPETEAPVAPIRIVGPLEEPRKTHHVNPVYPKQAMAARVQGVVILECTISPQGKVVAVKTLRSVPQLDEAAMAAVKQWEYTPTAINGVAVPVIMTVTVNFKLN